MTLKSLIKKAMVIDSDITLQKASDILTEHNINCLIYIKKSKILGILTKDDLVENFGKNDKVSKIMTKNVVTVTPDQKESVAVSLMRKHKINVIPVIDGKKNLVGVVNMEDIVSESEDDGDFLFE
jgi:CBS domain-containing protein